MFQQVINRVADLINSLSTKLLTIYKTFKINIMSGTVKMFVIVLVAAVVAMYVHDAIKKNKFIG